MAQATAQFFFSGWVSSPLMLIDGDVYEERNRERVIFQTYDNKAVAKAQELRLAISNRVAIVPVLQYITPRNARRLIEERNIVFLFVDNHATRKTVSNRCRREALLITSLTNKEA